MPEGSVFLIGSPEASVPGAFPATNAAPSPLFMAAPVAGAAAPLAASLPSVQTSAPSTLGVPADLAAALAALLTTPAPADAFEGTLAKLSGRTDTGGANVDLEVPLDEALPTEAQLLPEATDQLATPGSDAEALAVAVQSFLDGLGGVAESLAGPNGEYLGYWALATVLVVGYAVHRRHARRKAAELLPAESLALPFVTASR